MENIIYIPNYEAFLQELQEKETEIVNQTPTVIKDNKALFVTLDNLDLESVEVLRDYEDVFSDATKLAKYKLVNDYETAIGQDEEGNDIFPNKYIGSFGLPPLTAEEKEKILQEKREAALSSLTITISTGKVFNGNKSSIGDLLNAINTAREYELLQGEALLTTEWRLKDNTTQIVTLDEIREAYVIGNLQYSTTFIEYSKGLI